VSLLSATLKLDVRLQARSQLYSVGIAVAVLFGLLGRFFFDPAYAGRVLAAFYLMGIGGTTYMFGASLLLLEKSEGTLHALRTSPLTSSAYITSKAITLSSFAVIESVIVYAVAFFGISVSPLPMVLGVVCLGVLYTLIGMGQVASHDSVTSFLIPDAMAVGAVLQLPAFYILQLGPPWAWYLIPTQGPLILMLGASETLALWQWVYGVGMSVVSIVLAGWWAKLRFARLIGLRGGRPW
jgi:fluoroquinolone transport system permease protein